MKLQNNLYTIINKKVADDAMTYSVGLLGECFIYKAHFPGQPITPGVCVMQIAVELAEDLLGLSLSLVGVKNIKFLSVITPDEVKSVDYVISSTQEEDETIKLKVVVKDETTTYSKMSLICKKK